MLVDCIIPHRSGAVGMTYACVEHPKKEIVTLVYVAAQGPFPIDIAVLCPHRSRVWHHVNKDLCFIEIDFRRGFSYASRRPRAATKRSSAEQKCNCENQARFHRAPPLP